MQCPNTDFIITYHKADLNNQDYAGFKPGQWLTSGGIQFYLEHLRQEFQLPKYYLMDPSQAQLIIDPYSGIQCPQFQPLIKIILFSEFNDLVDWYYDAFSSAEYIFMPVNNAESHSIPGGGSHWALLVLEKNQQNKFIYYDSAGSFVNNASKIAVMVNAIIQKDKSILKKQNTEISVNNTTPRQYNSFDCGVFVLTITESLLHIIQKDPSIQSILGNKQLPTLASQHVVTKKRKEILDFAAKLLKEQHEKQ